MESKRGIKQKKFLPKTRHRAGTIDFQNFIFRRSSRLENWTKLPISPRKLVRIKMEKSKRRRCHWPFLFVDLGHNGVLGVQAQKSRHHLLTKVEVDKAGARQFGDPTPSWIQALHAVVEAFLCWNKSKEVGMLPYFLMTHVKTSHEWILDRKNT